MSMLANDKKIIFIGDSITEGFDLKKYFPSFNIINEGISGNSTIDIINRLDQSIFRHNPDVVFLLIGTNDIDVPSLPNDEVIYNIKKIIKTIQKKLKHVKLYVQSIYPVFYDMNPLSVGKRKNKDILYINEKIKNIKNITYIDMDVILSDENGNLNKLYTYDGLHISDLGYDVISEKLKQYL